MIRRDGRSSIYTTTRRKSASRTVVAYKPVLSNKEVGSRGATAPREGPFK